MRYGIFLAAGIFILGLAGAALSWYPSRIGGPAYWLDDRLYAPIIAAVTSAPGWPLNAGLLYALGLALAFGGYLGGAMWAARHPSPGRRAFALVLGLQVALCAWLCVEPYISSQDIFSYAFYAHIVTWYHANPYVVVPRDYPFDPLFSLIFWKDQPSNYGPIWTYLSALASLVVGTDSGALISALRVLGAGAAVAGTAVIWSFAARVNPRRQLVATLLWAWNPLLLIESAGAGHNDVLMAVFIIASLACWYRRWRTAAIGFLVLAFLTKYVAAILIPLYLMAWIRAEPGHRMSAVLRTAFVGGVLTLVSFAPVYAGPSSLGVIGFGSNPLAYINSPLELAYRDLRVALGEPDALVNLPLHYLGFWVAGETSVVLWDEPDTSHSLAIALPAEEPILVIESPSGEWLHVYEPRLGRFGFVHADEVRRIAAPILLPADPSTEQVIDGATEDPRAVKSNEFLRLVSLALFALAYLHYLRRSADGDQLIRSGLTVLLVFLMVVQSWFWPWYLIWALPFAVFATETLGGRALLALTATASVLNVQPAISAPSSLDWLLQARMLAIDGGPFLGVALAFAYARQRHVIRRRIRRVRLPTWRETVAHPFLGWTTVTLGAIVLVGLPTAALLSRASAANHVRTLVVPWVKDYAQAQQLLASGNYQGASMAATAVLQAQPGEIAARRLRMSANLAMHRYGDVIPDLSSLLADDPNNVELLLERADLYVRVQRDDRARADYARAVILAPRDPTGYVGVGTVDFLDGNLDSSSLWLSCALAIEPSRTDALRLLATTYAAMGRTSDAIQVYNQVIEQTPLDAETYADRAAVFEEAGRAPGAASDLRQLLVLSGDVQVNQWAARLLADVESSNSARIKSLGQS